MKAKVTCVRLAEPAYAAALKEARRERLSLGTYLRRLLEWHFVGEPIVTVEYRKRPLRKD